MEWHELPAPIAQQVVVVLRQVLGQLEALFALTPQTITVQTLQDNVVEGAKTWVVRVRPQSPEPGATRVLELGTIAPGGAFAPRDILTAASKLTDVALAADRHGALWVAWVDAGGSWLERVVCR